MRILNLIVKQVFFDQILAGTKKEEYRDVKPTTMKKYLRVACCGQEFDGFKPALHTISRVGRRGAISAT